MLNLEGNNSFYARTGIDLSSVQQNSAEWLRAKLGVISASKTDCLLAGKETAKRSTYMAELVAQVATKQQEEINSYHLQWGKDNEQAARASFEYSSGLKVKEMAFIFKDDTHRTGVSVDGLLYDQDDIYLDMGLELKAPSNSTNYIKFVCYDFVKKEWDLQCNMSMWVTGAHTWINGQYDKRCSSKPLHYIEIPRNEITMRRLDDAVPQFIHDMDKMLDQMGLVYGSQWSDA